jgi:Ca2+-binding EF-hand superfamily protein
MLISGFLMGAVAVTTVYIALPYFEERVPRAAAESFARHDSNVDGYISLGEFLAPLSNATNIVTIKSGTIKLEGETDILEGTADLKEKIETLISTQASTQINYKEVSEQVEADRKCREAMIAFNASNRTIEFGRLDEDSDNRLSLIEFSKSSYVPKRETIHAEFNSLDQNEDGILTRDEMETPFKPTTFTLKKAEWKNRVVTALPIPCLNRPHENADSVIIANIGPTVISDMASSSDDKFKELDENNDRKITLDEYLRANGVIL